MTRLSANQAAALIYVRHHPGCTTKDVAFNVIYGPGTVGQGWLALPAKDRDNYLSLASRVLRHLESIGYVVNRDKRRTHSSWHPTGKGLEDEHRQEPGWNYGRRSDGKSWWSDGGWGRIT